MEPTLGPPSNDHFPSYGYFLIFGILLGIGVAIPFHSALGADAQEQIEMNDLVNDQLDISPQQNSDNLRPHRGRQLLPLELRDFQNNLIEYRIDGGHLRNPRLPELPVEMRELQNNLINLHPDGDVSGEHRVYGLPEILVEQQNLRNKLDNLPNGDVLRNQEHSL